MRLDPLRQSHVAHGWSQAEIQWAFSIFIVTETWLTPPAGAIVDGLGPRIGPSLMIAAGDGLGGAGWVVNGYADDGLVLLYAGAALYESNSTSIEMLRSTIFWLLYAIFVCVSASGLMATAQLGPIAQD